MTGLATAPRQGAPVRAPRLQPFDIEHATHTALVDPDTAFWGLVRKEQAAGSLEAGPLFEAWRAHADAFDKEMNLLRFGLKPSAVYFNPTERCNLNCSYCYIPEAMRRSGEHMGQDRVLDALTRLDVYFRGHMPEDRLPQVIFHGAEPMLNREAIFAGIDAFKDRFRFGVQTNATLLDDAAIDFLTSRGVGIGLSLDGPVAEVANRTRRRWNGDGVFDKVVAAIDKLDGYAGFNVICTMTTENLPHLTSLVEFFHDHRVPACLLNVTRCTQPGSRVTRGDDLTVSKAFLAALDRSHQLYMESGRKLVVANFANILLAILAPTARRLMCDISPCGGGRSFFALAANGDLFPCSEFIGLPSFAGGNLFRQPIADILQTAPFRRVSERKIEEIDDCKDCEIKHFCGSPCPAEAFEMNGGMEQKGAFCEFYKEQTRYALRQIADGHHEDFLWDGWDNGTEVSLAIGAA